MKTLNKTVNCDRIKAPVFMGITPFFNGAGCVMLAVALIFSSCQKFLDVKKFNRQKFIETAADCQSILDHYDIMNTNYPNLGQASSDDYYLGSNIYPGNFSQENKDIYTWQALAMTGSDAQWITPYTKIYYTNLVLETAEKIKNNTDAATLNTIRGSALFLRAYSFWNLAQVYCKPYGTTSAQDPGIPLRTSSDLNDLFGRGTVKETYDRITQDLQEAANLLPVTSGSSPAVNACRPNKVSAYAMLARVYLSMEDYVQALSNANSCLELKKVLLDYNAISTSNNLPFPQFNDEVLFQSTLTIGSAGTPTNNQLLYPGDAGTPGARINQALYNSYDANDLRKAIYFKENSGLNAGTCRFTGNYEPSSGANLFNGLAVDEVYLIRAECYARASNISSAMGDLNTLLSKRWKNTVTYPVVTAGTVDEAVKKILDERRKELVMRGSRWTDLRRLNKDTRFKVDLVRTTGSAPNEVTYTLPANDPKYTLLLPYNVIDKGGYPQNQR